MIDIKLIEEARSIRALAVQDLGPDLGGHSLVDLLADNMVNIPLKTLRSIVEHIDNDDLMVSMDT